MSSRAGGAGCSQGALRCGISERPRALCSDESGSGAATSLWSIAGALTATVKQRTADVLSAVQTTDWKAELSALQKGIKEEGGEAVSRAKAAAEHLPAAVEGLPENVSLSGGDSPRDPYFHLLPLNGTLIFPQATAALRSRARSAHLQLEVASKGLGSLGHKLVQGTSELFDQISHAIQHELEPTDADAGTPRGPASAPSPEKYSRSTAQQPEPRPCMPVSTCCLGCSCTPGVHALLQV